MILTDTTQILFKQIIDMLNSITNEQYVYKSKLMKGASIGQHLRHIIELFTELKKGYDTGFVDYEKRERNLLIETDMAVAVAQLNLITDTLSPDNKPLLLNTDYSIKEGNNIVVSTNYYREIIYNIEHSIHHMALMRIAVEADCGINLPDSFGVAPSTLKYRQACVQ